MKWAPWVLFLMWGCSPNSSEDFRHEGEARCRTIVTLLEKIENREQLLSAEQDLKKQFEALTDLMIEARKFQQGHLDDVSTEIVYEGNLAEAALEEELRRIYALEGGREIVERAQQEALVRLDAFERKLSKQKEQLKPL
ncbi:MAG: hypothetical protein HYX67_16225 [Candidatus Melainabacteria bacterium]|nr:hypothetical protein [Candidatus Melainabacteria bacterium]